MATRLGDHPFDDKLDDLSPDGAKPRSSATARLWPSLPRKIDACSSRATGRSITRSSAATWTRRLARRDLPAVRGRPAHLRRLPDRERLPAAHPVDAAPGGRTSRTPWRGWTQIPRVVEIARATIRTRRGSRSRRRSARPRGPSTSTRAISSPWPAGARGTGRAAARRHRRSRRARGAPGLPQGRGLAPVDRRTGGSARNCLRKKLDLELDAGISAAEVLARRSARRAASSARWR